MRVEQLEAGKFYWDGVGRLTLRRLDRFEPDGVARYTSSYGSSTCRTQTFANWAKSEIAPTPEELKKVGQSDASGHDRIVAITNLVLASVIQNGFILTKADGAAGDQDLEAISEMVAFQLFESGLRL